MEWTSGLFIPPLSFRKTTATNHILTIKHGQVVQFDLYKHHNSLSKILVPSVYFTL